MAVPTYWRVRGVSQVEAYSPNDRIRLELDQNRVRRRRELWGQSLAT